LPRVRAEKPTVRANTAHAKQADRQKDERQHAKKNVDYSDIDHVIEANNADNDDNTLADAQYEQLNAGSSSNNMMNSLELSEYDEDEERNGVSDGEDQFNESVDPIDEQLYDTDIDDGEGKFQKLEYGL